MKNFANLKLWTSSTQFSFSNNIHDNILLDLSSQKYLYLVVQVFIHFPRVVVSSSPIRRASRSWCRGRWSPRAFSRSCAPSMWTRSTATAPIWACASSRQRRWRRWCRRNNWPRRKRSPLQKMPTKPLQNKKRTIHDHDSSQEYFRNPPFLSP